MKRSPNPSFSYEIVLTTLGFVLTISCSAPDRTVVATIVTVPNESAPPPSSSVTPVNQEPPSRVSPRMWTWETNVDQARARARREHLPLVIYLRADWSAGSLEMDRTVWSDPRILLARRPVVPLRLDVTDGANAELWAEQFEARAIPVTIFIDADGREVVRLDGPRSVDEVLEAMRKLDER